MNARAVVTALCVCAACACAPSLHAGEDSKDAAGAEVVPLPEDPPPPVTPKPDVPKPAETPTVTKPAPTPEPGAANAETVPIPSTTPAPDATPPQPVRPVVTTPPAPAPQPDPVPVAPPLPRVPAPVVIEGDPAETIPLPAERPDVKPTQGETALVQPEASDEELKKVALMLDARPAAQGEPIAFNLFGPEAFLRSARAQLSVKDGFGREIFRGSLAVIDLPFAEGKPRQIQLTLAKPLCEQHTLHLKLSGAAGKSVELAAPFTVAVAPAEWDGWLALISLPPDAKGWATLQSLGVRGGMQYRLHAGRRDALRSARAPFFVENVSRHLFSRYHVEPGLWDKTLARMKSATGDRTRYFREPSLCSTQFAEALAREIKAHGEAYAKDPPLFYSLAAEPSTTRLAAAADFDFAPPALEEFQRWLERDIYGTVAAVNAAWGTNFKSWADVTPMTTDEARLRVADGVLNLSPWVDFRDFQDYWFAKTLRNGASYLRQFDPRARAGITGAMGAFAFGGWDWSRLSQSLDVVEAYDIAHARELWRDLAPGKPALAVLPLMETTDGPPQPSDAIRTLWRFALEGGPRAALLWDDSGEGAARRSLLEADGRPSALAESLAPHLKALDGSVGKLLARCEHAHDGVAILYSPASLRVHWLLEAQRLHGAEWMKAWGADTAGERRKSPQLRLRESWIKLLEDLGLGWRFVSTRELLEQKILARPDSGIRTLILPRAVALSDDEAAAIREFAAGGGRVIADAACGRFDSHGRLRDKPALDDLFHVDTSREPFAAEPVNPLEEIRLPAAEGANVTLPPYLTRENLRRLAPVFSDAPRWLGPWRTPEYRRSPVLAIGKARSAFLNLDLTDYCRWRLQPGNERAQAVRDVLGGLLFSELRENASIDWNASRLPHGTQVVWLKPREESPSRVLALRRNPQGRLHELGGPEDSNALFDKPEAYKLVLRKPARALPLFPAGAALKASETLEGVLDPAAPSVFLLSAEAPPALRVTPQAGARAGEMWTARVEAPAQKALFMEVLWTAPDGMQRPEYGNVVSRDVASAEIQVPFAFNDAPGTWTLTLRDLLHGAELRTSVELAPAK